MQKVRDPGLEFLKYSEKKFCKSLLKPYFDPLVWNKDVGYLPGSMLKFRQNKLGMIELYENKKPVNNGESKCDSPCDTPNYGDITDIKTDKIDSNYEIGDQDSKEKSSKDKLKNGIRPSLNTSSYGRQRKRRMIDGEVVGYGSKCRNDKVDRDSAKLRLTNFSWRKYLDTVCAKAVPVKLFSNIGIHLCDNQVINDKSAFKLYQKLEGVDPNNESLFCVLTIAEKIGNRLRLHFDGYSYQFDFWTTVDSQLIFPVGWCEKHNRKLRPPKDYTNESFSWNSYLLKTKTEAVPENCFQIIQNPISANNKFIVGHKLEAVDKRNSGMICVATIKDNIGDNVLIHFDSWDSSFDMWTHHNSPLLMPVGYCEDNEKILSIPASYGQDLSSFNWNSYLGDTNSVAVPRSVFEERNQWWFDIEIGMRCEVIDKRFPQLIRVANIVQLNDECQITIGFDDWSDKYNYKIDLGSSWLNMLPVGWCENNGCIVQPPPTYDSSIETSTCSIYGCKGYGHVKGPTYSNHQRTSGCPYAECNLNKELKSVERIPLSAIDLLEISEISVEHNSPVEETLSIEIKMENTTDKELTIEIPYDDSEPMDLSMKEYKDSSPTNISNSLSIKQSEILDDEQYFDNPPGDFVPTKIKNFPNSLSLTDFKNRDNQSNYEYNFFHQYHAPKNLIPNSVAIIPLSVLRPYTNKVPYHPSDDYRRIMEWNIIEQILPSLKTVKLTNSDKVPDEVKVNKVMKPKGKIRRNICKKSRSSVNITEQFKELNGLKSILDWNCYEVSQLISSVIGTNQYSKAFVEQEVDGAAFLCLKQMDLMKVLGMKLGPAIKLSSGIQYLRQLYPESKLPELV